MEKILTSLEIINRNCKEIPYEGTEINKYELAEDIKNLIRLHVKAALEVAAEKALVHQKCNNYHTAKTMWEDKQYEVYVTVINDNSYDEHHCISIDKESILNAYPENLIK